MAAAEWPKLPGEGPGPGDGLDSEQQQIPKSYSGIAAINKSVRDNKNVLEVRLEKSENARFYLNNIETEGLLTKLGIDSSHFTGVSSCPEGKGVVYITLHPSVNINRFLHKNEAYVLKEGVQTSIIRPAGKKEVSVLVSGLHPNTKDQAVIRYLAAHGKVSPSDPAIHHVYPGRPGSSMLAGKLNGNRSYMVEITKPMGSFHIIDGEKVSIRYRGQLRTCARCHQPETQCPGKSVAKECTAPRVLLSCHMQEHWKTVSYVPDRDSDNLEEVEEETMVNVQIGPKKVENEGPDLTPRYNSVIINGFLPDTDLVQVHDILLGHGLPTGCLVTDILRRERAGKLTISNLSSDTCVDLMDRLHGKVFLKRKIYVTAVVAASPQKPALNINETMKPQSDHLPSPTGAATPTKTSARKLSLASPTRPPGTSAQPSSPTTSSSPSSKEKSAPTLASSGSDSSCGSDTLSTVPSGSLLNALNPTAVGSGIKEKIDIFNEKNDNNVADKRKAESSPEMTKIEKKKLKDAKKAQKKQEFRDKNQLILNQS